MVVLINVHLFLPTLQNTPPPPEHVHLFSKSVKNHARLTRKIIGSYSTVFIELYIRKAKGTGNFELFLFTSYHNYFSSHFAFRYQISMWHNTVPSRQLFSRTEYDLLIENLSEDLLLHD